MPQGENMKWTIAFAMSLFASLAISQHAAVAGSYQSGYVWAQMHHIDDASECPGKSESFASGCKNYSEELRRTEAVAEVLRGKPAELTWVGRICSSNSDKCRAVCEANNNLKSAADDLSRCAAQHDYSDSCDSQFTDARDAHDELESAVSDADDDCH